jgi:hypothetical protein
MSDQKKPGLGPSRPTKPPNLITHGEDVSDLRRVIIQIQGASSAKPPQSGGSAQSSGGTAEGTKK